MGLRGPRGHHVCAEPGGGTTWEPQIGSPIKKYGFEGSQVHSQKITDVHIRGGGQVYIPGVGVGYQDFRMFMHNAAVLPSTLATS